MSEPRLVDLSHCPWVASATRSAVCLWSRLCGLRGELFESDNLAEVHAADVSAVKVDTEQAGIVDGRLTQV